MATGSGFFSSRGATTADKRDSTTKAESATKSGGEWSRRTTQCVREESSTVSETPKAGQRAFKFDGCRGR